MTLSKHALAASLLFVSLSFDANGQEHDHFGHDATKVAPPKVFLDKSPRIVAYQLKRLDNQRLLMVPRDTNDKKYAPVYEAILTRAGMSPQYLEEAAVGLATIHSKTVAAELIGALSRMDRNNKPVLLKVAGMLLRQPRERLSEATEQLEALTESTNDVQRAIGYAGLIISGNAPRSIQLAQRSEDSMLDWLAAIELIPSAETRLSFRESITHQLNAKSVAVRAAAIRCIASIPVEQSNTFELVSRYVNEDDLRAECVRTLLTVPDRFRDDATSEKIVATLVDHAEQTAAEDRTSDEFVDAMQLVDQLMSHIPTNQAIKYRARLANVSVRVVRIRTVEEEMRYDIPYFAVQAGRPVQIVLENHDLMPHNLVITTPGSLKEVAQQGLTVGPDGGWNGLPFVPVSEHVLAATDMVQPDRTVRLTFDAPTELGEYPYVCTFPQHWYRMYGVMVVVEDVDTWQKSPIEPANPIGSNRSFVANWSADDLRGELASGMRGRSAEIGKKIFVEASCQSCHKFANEGGTIGPDLTDVLARWKDDRVGVLREILDPSHKVDAKYKMHKVLTEDGNVFSGLIVNEDKDTVTLLTNPEAKEPMRIPRDMITEMVESPNSMMPKALLDQYTKDEIFELMAYLENAQSD